MKHRKIRKSVFNKLIDNDTDLEPRTLDHTFSASKACAEEFHPFCVQLLLESGLTLEESLVLLADGAYRPN
jgi:hypothetical protein